jgi:hypothetical protein
MIMGFKYSVLIGGSKVGTVVAGNIIHARQKAQDWFGRCGRPKVIYAGVAKHARN